MLRLLLLVGAIYVAEADIRGGLLPKIMKARLCEMEPALRICRQEIIPIQHDALSYSRWSLCDSRPYLTICRYRPGKFDEFEDFQKQKDLMQKKAIEVIEEQPSDNESPATSQELQYEEEQPFTFTSIFE